MKSFNNNSRIIIMGKIAIIGYACMIFTLVVSILFIYGFIATDIVSMVISIVPMWLWGILSIYLLWKREIDGLLLSTGFITFTMLVTFIIYYAISIV